MSEKTYYYIQLRKDFFKRSDITLVETMPDGKEYVLLYIKLLLESIDLKGELRLSDKIPYNENMLSIITGTNVDMLKSAMKVFENMNMIEILDDGTIFLPETVKLLGGECESAHRVRKYREKQKQAMYNHNKFMEKATEWRDNYDSTVTKSDR